MTTAFLATAFQNNAFQIDGVTPPTPSRGGGGGNSFWTPNDRKRKRLERDKLAEAIQEALNPTPVVVEVEAESVQVEAPKPRPVIVPPLVAEPLDITPVADAVAALLAKQVALAEAQRQALAEAEDDDEAMALIHALLL